MEVEDAVEGDREVRTADGKMPPETSVLEVARLIYQRKSGGVPGVTPTDPLGTRVNMLEE